MRHGNSGRKLGRTSSHRRCMFANMLKSLIDNERIVTTLPKAKELKRKADKMITLAKKDTLAARRKAIAELMVQFNTLTPKEKRQAKEGNTEAYNIDRKVIVKLFDVLGKRYTQRQGGYTRIMKMSEKRAGDNAQKCVIEYLPE
jgi:large subunit ribosomal protein L17